MAWDNSITLTIDYTKVDSALTNFPVAVNLSSSSGISSFDATAIFTELGANSKKLKIEDSLNNQCYVEIENWENGSNKATLHFKAPTISSTVNTVFTLYYDSSEADNTAYIGDTGSAVAQNVWDSDFSAVYHMAQDPTGGAGSILDSTTNTNNGTPNGSMTTGDLVDGNIGKALDFDGSDDSISCGTGSSLNFPSSDLTIDLVYKTTDTAGMLLNKRPYEDINVGYDIFISSGKIATRFGNVSLFSTAVTINDGAWHNSSLVYDRDDVITLFTDGSSTDTSSSISSVTDPTTSQELTLADRNISGHHIYFDGIEAEVRLSKTARSAAWIKGTYNSLFDSLITFSTDVIIDSQSFSMVGNISTSLNSRLLSQTFSISNTLYSEAQPPIFLVAALPMQISNALDSSLRVNVISDILQCTNSLFASPLNSIASSVFIQASALQISDAIQVRILDTSDFQVDNSLSTSLLIKLNSPIFALSNIISSAPKPIITANVFSQSNILTISDVLQVQILDAQTFQINSSLSASLLVGLDSQIFALSNSLNAKTFMKLDTAVFSLSTSLQMGDTVTFTTEYADVYYLFTLTGEADSTTDIEIPIKSFQGRLRSGDPSYLSVVIPGLDHSADITARSNGDLVIEMAYKIEGAYIQREEIARVTLEDIRIDQGARNQSISLSGHKTESYSTKAVEITQPPIYYNLSAGKVRYRFPTANMNLNPGDTLTVGTDVFTAGLITYTIGVASQQMEVAEA